MPSKEPDTTWCRHADTQHAVAAITGTTAVRSQDATRCAERALASLPGHPAPATTAAPFSADAYWPLPNA